MAVDMFLKILDSGGSPVNGESQDSVHKDEIDVQSWSWGMSQSGSMHTATGCGSGKASVQDLSVTKKADKATPILMQYCNSGKHFQSATLTVRKAGGNPVEYMVITMNSVMPTSISTGSSGEDLMEHITLNFADYHVSYTPQTDTGDPGASIEHHFNIRENVVGQ